MPSHAYETLGKTILESYALGRAVVASDMGSRRELVHQGETGFLYRCGDVNQLAEAIRELVSNPDLARTNGELPAGSGCVQHHSPESHYQKLLSLYEGLAARRQSSGRGVFRRKTVMDKTSQPCDSPAARHFHRRTAAKICEIAFIGGRGVISKYSGIEAYYEEVGKTTGRDGT